MRSTDVASASGVPTGPPQAKVGNADEEVGQSDEFTLPHPRAVDRLFVLKPASQLMPDAIWPGLGKSIARLLDELETDEEVYALEERPPFCVAVA